MLYNNGFTVAVLKADEDVRSVQESDPVSSPFLRLLDYSRHNDEGTGLLQQVICYLIVDV